jgi:DNA-binding response OmpR family regulator
MAKHILLVDDDALMRRSLTFSLEQAGYRVNASANAEDALALARRDPPNLVLLDIGLPGMDGFDALRQLKQEGNVPVIFLTARRRNLDEALGLELGADDYVTKPFDIDVLLAHIKAVLRRSDSTPELQPPPEIRLGDLFIDRSSHIVSLYEQPIELTPREFDLLHFLIQHRGQIVTRDRVLDKIWGHDSYTTVRTVDNYILRLRKKLEPDPAAPQFILSIYGGGYKFVG